MFRLTNNYWPVEPREEGALKGQKVTAREQPWQIRTEPPIPFIPYAANSNRFPNQDASHLPELRYENKTNNKLDNKSPINYQNTIHFRAASEGVNLLPTVLPVYDTVLNSKCNLDLSH